MTIAHSSTQFSATDQITATTVSVAVSGTNPALLLRVAYKGTTVVISGTPTFNGSENFTLIGTDFNTDARSYLYLLPNPTATTADVSVLPTVKTRAVVSVSLYTGSVNPIALNSGSEATANGLDDTPTVDITGVSGEMIIDSMCQVSNGPDTITANSGTLRLDEASTGGGGDTAAGGQELAATGGADTMSYTMSGADNWAIVAASFKEAAAGGQSIVPHVILQHAMRN